MFSNDIHYIPAVLKFDKKIIVGHYPTVLIPGHEMYSIFYGEKFFDIDTGNERRDEGGRLHVFAWMMEKNFTYRGK